MGLLISGALVFDGFLFLSGKPPTHPGPGLDEGPEIFLIFARILKKDTLGIQRPLNKYSLLEKPIVLLGIYNQHFQGIIGLMVFDFQGIYWFLFIHT